MSRQVVEIPIEVWEQCQRDVETISALHKECIRLNTEVERLRKAGDELRDSLPYIVDERLDDKTMRKIMKRWNAAKKGKPQS